MMKINLFEIETTNLQVNFDKIFDNDVKTVVSIIKKYNFDLRVVGGAVRDLIIDREPRDIDFITNAAPDELIYIFNKENIEYDTSGIIHATIKAVFNKDKKIDITSIKKRLKDVDNKITSVKIDSWEKDSAIRDLTINSMSLDLDGNLYDYQNGYEDLKSQLVRFNQNAESKIKDDPFVILRWIKAISLFKDPKWVKKDRQLIQNNIHLLTNLKNDKRVKYLIATLSKQKNWADIKNLICKLKISEYIDISC